MHASTVMRFGLLVACLAACKRQEVRYYEIPKAARAPVATQNQELPPGHPAVAQAAPVIDWEVPDGWTDNGPDRVRRGSFHIHDENQANANVAVIDMPAEGDNEARMVKLLGRELQISVGDDATFAPQVSNRRLGPHDYRTYSLQSGESDSAEEPRKAALAAFLTDKNRLWYFRMTGDESVVKANRETFDQFLATVKLLEPPPRPSSPMPTGGSMAARSLPPGAVAQGSIPHWSVPDEWSPGRKSQMRKGSFSATGGDGHILDISVTAFPGDVGGIASNVNRWRGQLGLPPVDANSAAGLITRLSVNGRECLLVDLVSDLPLAGRSVPQRMIVGTIMHEGSSWFFKMIGDAPLAETERERFMTFLQSVIF